MKSPEFRKQKERSCGEAQQASAWVKYLECPDVEAGETEDMALKLKVKAHRLRLQRRRAERLHRQLQNQVISELRPRDQVLYNLWTSGELAKDLDDVTTRHGYGKLSNGKILVAPSLNDFLPSRWEQDSVG